MKNIILKSLLILMTSCISTMNVIAQDKKSFTLEDLMPGGESAWAERGGRRMCQRRHRRGKSGEPDQRKRDCSLHLTRHK